MAQANEAEALSIEEAADGYVFNLPGETPRRIALSNAEVVQLARALPALARRIIAAKAKPAAEGVDVAVASAVTEYRVNLDVHGDVVLLRLKDAYDGVFDFAMPADGAQRLGEALNAGAEQALAAPKTTRQ
jgi:hypothetical protein